MLSCFLRNAQYYQTQILEQQSEFGGMRLVQEEKLVCIYAYAKEEGPGDQGNHFYLKGKKISSGRRWMVLENRKKRFRFMA